MATLAQVVEDCFGVLQLHSDGTVYRANESLIDFGDHNKDATTKYVEEGCHVEWEDCIFDDQHQLYLRVYKPTYELCTTNNNHHKKLLPILYYLHGGGFCLGSRTWPNCHNCCLRLSSQLQALVIAPDYRFALHPNLFPTFFFIFLSFLQGKRKLVALVNRSSQPKD